jgi:hypothetical protein
VLRPVFVFFVGTRPMTSKRSVASCFGDWRL